VATEVVVEGADADGLQKLNLSEEKLEKLRSFGYTLEMVAVSTPAELSTILDIKDSEAVRLINAAKSSVDLGNGFRTGVNLMEERKTVQKVTTGSKSLDDLLGGGIETQAITEFFGEYGSGKSQLCFQLSVNIQLPEEEGGLSGVAAIIDTEGTFRPERIAQMAEARGLNSDDVLKKVFVARAYNSSHQMLLVDHVYELARRENVKLIVVDSLTSLFRAEYVGRGTLAERQQKLNRHMHDLLRLGRRLNAAIIVTNQVMAKPDTFFRDPTKPIGGNIVGHTATFRIYLRKSKGELRIARLIDSPYLPDGEATIKVTENGIEDTESGGRRKK